MIAFSHVGLYEWTLIVIGSIVVVLQVVVWRMNKKNEKKK